jgi:hypothetical protein
MSDDPVETGFVRRRRFLIATSLTLAAAGYLGLQLPEINVLGNRLPVGHPERVLIIGYLVWAWALWTYTQWFRDCGAWTRTRSMFVQLRDEKLRRALAGARPPDESFGAFRTNRTAEATNSRHQDSLGLVFKRLEFSSRPDGIQRNPDGRLEAVCVMEAKYRTFPGGFQAFGNPELFVVSIPRALEWRVSGRALWSLVNSTRYFSEYFAPYIFSALPLIAPFVHPALSDAWPDPGFRE